MECALLSQSVWWNVKGAKTLACVWHWSQEDYVHLLTNVVTDLLHSALFWESVARFFLSFADSCTWSRNFMCVWAYACRLNECRTGCSCACLLVCKNSPTSRVILLFHDVFRRYSCEKKSEEISWHRGMNQFTTSISWRVNRRTLPQLSPLLQPA